MARRPLPDRRYRTRPIESLERRQMLDHASAWVAAAVARRDFEDLAGGLLVHPLRAERLGLGRLANVLENRPEVVRRVGAAAVLKGFLNRHPGYARRHGLEGLLTGPGGVRSSGDPGHVIFRRPRGGNISLPGHLGGGVLMHLNDMSDCSGDEPMAGPTLAGGGAGGIAGGGGRGSGGLNPQLFTEVSDNSPVDSDIGLATGAFYQDHWLVPYSSMDDLQALQLRYNSLQADPRPIVTFALTTGAGSTWSAATQVTAQLSIDGVSQGSAATYSVSSLAAGDTFLIGLQGDATSLATGVHNATITIVVSGGGFSSSHGYTMPVAVINAAAGAYGAGWNFRGLQSIATSGVSTSVLLVDGSNNGEIFAYDGTNYSGPAGNTTTLVHNVGGTWTRTYTNGIVLQFDSSGRETSATDPNGNTSTFAYVSSGAAAGALSTITDPAGLITTLAYDGSGKLHTVTDPAGRVTTVTVDGNGNLTDIVDPDSAHTQYGYSTPSNHRETTEVSPNGATATATYDAFGRTASETLFGGGATTSVVYGQKAGLLAAGGSGALLMARHPTASATDPNGHTVTLVLDDMYDPIRIEDATGAVATIVRDSHEWPTSVTDPLGRATTYSYNSNGKVTGVTRPDGTSMAIAYGTNDQVTQVTDYRGLVTTYTLDSDGNATRRTDPDGNHEDWTYNAAGQVLTATDRNGHTTSFAYDSYGRLTTITLPDAGLGTATGTIAYDSAGNVTGTTDALGHATHYTYDLAGRVKSVADPVQYGAGHATSYTYDADGNLTAITDALGHVTSLAYDARDRLTTLTDAANQGTGHATTYAYDGMNLTSATDPNGHATTYAYDGVNRPVGSTDPLGHRTTVVYDLAGQVTQSTDANGHTVTYAYDLAGRVGTVTYPGTADNGSGTMIAVTARYAYNNDDQVTAVTDSLGHTTTYSYDNLGRTTAVTDALGHATSFGYDLAGNRTTVTDALGHTTTSTFDARDELRTVTEPSGGGTTTYSYDQGGRLVSLTDPVGNATSWSYDNADRVLVETDPRGKLTTYTYDLAGNLTTKADRDLRVTSFAYDADDRLKTEDWMSGGSSIRTTSYAYDYGGRLTSVQDPDSHYAFAYDNANRLLTVDDNGTIMLPQVTLTYGYDNAGNRTSLDDSLGGLTSYVYDVRDELVTINQSGSGVASKRADFAYDAAGRMTTLTRYSDTTGTTTVLVSKYAYDAANRLTTLTHQTAGATVRSQYAYTLDAANRLTGESRTWTTGGGTATDTLAYSYTNNDQLTGVTHTNGSFGTETYAYDNNGNRNSSGYSTTTGNRMTTDGTYNYAYDDEGNLTSKTTISSGDQALYSYDYHNRLVEVDSLPYGGVTSVVAKYVYDALGRRIGVQEGWSAGTASTVSDGGFESPYAGPTGTWTSFVVDPTGTAWTYTGSAGVTANGSGHTAGNPNAPEGTQVAFLQYGTSSTISQTIAGWSAGTYRITFDAAQRANYQDSYQVFEVLVDGKVVGVFRPGGTSYAAYRTDDFTVSAGTHTISFVGLNPNGGDNTALIDAVAIAAVAASDQTWTLYDGVSAILDFDGGGTQKARYLQGPAVDMILARETGSGTVAWYLADRLGTVRDIADNSGAIVDHVDYDSYGNVVAESAPSYGDRWKFTGREYDVATGLYYYRARWYDPRSGRFINQDPIGFGGGDGDLYRFVGNSPTIFTDPSGLQLTDEQKNVLNVHDRLAADGASYDDIVSSIILQALIEANGNNAVAFNLIYAIRNENDAALDSDYLASADHFFNAWNAQDMYKKSLGQNYFSRRIGGFNGTFFAWLYNAGKMPYIRDLLPRDNPKVPPTPLTWKQAWWGDRGGQFGRNFYTDMKIGSPEWKKFVYWLTQGSMPSINCSKT
ncbi:MAG: RHS repeat-associated core domain-containing protein [Isosphaeraceae bacterium]